MPLLRRQIYGGGGPQDDGGGRGVGTGHRHHRSFRRAGSALSGRPRCREASDHDSALRHYEAISAKDPNSWEARFYLAILRTHSIKNSEISSAAGGVISCLPIVLDLIRDYVPSEEEKKDAIITVINECNEAAEWLTGCSHNFCNSLTKGNGLMALTGVFGAISGAGSTLSAIGEDQDRCAKIANIMCLCGNYIEERFDMTDKDYCSAAVWCWQKMLEYHEDYHKVHSTQTLFDNESIERFNGKIRQYAPIAFGSGEESNQGVGEQTEQTADSQVCVLTLAYTSSGGAAGTLLYAINDSEKFSLPAGESRLFYLTPGQYTLRILNPMVKNSYVIDVRSQMTVNVQGKGLKMLVNVG